MFATTTTPQQMINNPPRDHHWSRVLFPRNGLKSGNDVSTFILVLSKFHMLGLHIVLLIKQCPPLRINVARLYNYLIYDLEILSSISFVTCPNFLPKLCAYGVARVREVTAYCWRPFGIPQHTFGICAKYLQAL
jgi:hypothetical protein